jgi:hypothetical protein
MRRSILPVVMASAIAVLACSLTTTAVAQSDAARAIYESAATVQTNIEGIRTFPAAPAEFNPLAASDEALASYGFPPRPDKVNDAHGYALWAGAMLRAKKRWNGELKSHPEATTRPVQLSKNQPPALAGNSATPVTFRSPNWSGVANTNKLTKWNSKTSFGSVFSQFNVPVVQQSFDVCDGGTDWEVTWNGIDGTGSGDVLQGGSSSQAICKNNKTSQNYYAWVEWYPSYFVTEVFPVNPGDDMYVETYDTSGGCNPGFVFVEDETTLAFGTFQLNWKSGPCLIGNSAEIIVERPFGDNNNFYPLANYIWDFALSWDFTLKGIEFGPGATNPTTQVFQMIDDNDTQVISLPVVEGKYSVFFYDTGCAYTGGCVF